MKTQTEIAALAAELSEADIASIIWAKCPKEIKGHKVTRVSMNCRPGSHGINMHAGRDSCVVSHQTFASAVAEISRELPADATEDAARLRAKAAELIAEADKLAAIDAV
jgi:hypothetical protein